MVLCHSTLDPQPLSTETLTLRSIWGHVLAAAARRCSASEFQARGRGQTEPSTIKIASFAKSRTTAPSTPVAQTLTQTLAVPEHLGAWGICD